MKALLIANVAYSANWHTDHYHFHLSTHWQQSDADVVGPRFVKNHLKHSIQLPSVKEMVMTYSNNSCLKTNQVSDYYLCSSFVWTNNDNFDYRTSDICCFTAQNLWVYLKINCFIQFGIINNFFTFYCTGSALLRKN